MDAYWALLAVICVERVCELVVSTRHANASLGRGGVESGAGHFPVMVALHFLLLVGCFVEPLALHGHGPPVHVGASVGGWDRLPREQHAHLARNVALRGHDQFAQRIHDHRVGILKIERNRFARSDIGS